MNYPFNILMILGIKEESILLYIVGYCYKYTRFVLQGHKWITRTDDRMDSVENSSMKQQQQRASSPARFKDLPAKAASKSASGKASGGASKSGGKSSRSNSPVTSKDRHAARGAAAVHGTGAESPTLRRAEKSKSIEERSSSSEEPYAADEPGLGADAARVVSDQPSSSKSSQGKRETARAEGGKTAKSAVGCGPGFWREGCLQSELIQFHMNKSLKKESGMKTPVTEPQLPPADAQRPSEASPPPNLELQEDIERLEDENEYLQV